MAQPATSICVYFDAEGTTTELAPTGSAGAPLEFEAYVIIFVEDAVTGASYTVNVIDENPANPVVYLGSDYPAGLQVGDPFTGIEVAFTGTQYGFLGTPVIVETMHYLKFVPANWDATTFSLTPHPNYMDLIYGDGEGTIQTLVTCAEAVDNDASSFGEIKSMFR